MTVYSDRQHQYFTPSTLCLTAFLVRVALIVYSHIQDSLLDVKYTDIDYVVFSNASRFVSVGMSPYVEPTYRYTPILAYMLLPNVYFVDFGKMLFCTFDFIVGYFIYYLVKSTGTSFDACVALFVWLFNPLTLVVSSRGNAESLQACLVILTLYFLTHNKDGYFCLLVAACFNGFAGHFKIYPVIYLPSAYLYCVLHGAEESISAKNVRQYTIRRLFSLLFRNIRGLVYVIASVIVFTLLFMWFYGLYGYEFAFQSYLYHFVRTDIKHNFSPYFYPLSKLQDFSGRSIVGLAAFVPQILSILWFALQYWQDLPFCWFITTFAFVTFNKVCTSQYFLWYLCLLPCSLSRLLFTIKEVMLLLSLWAGAQGLWLFVAYLFEFQHWNVEFYVFLASALFLVVNIYCIVCITRAYKPTKCKRF